MIKPSPTYNLEVNNKQLAMEWHPKLNGDLTPSEVTPKSGKKVWWICGFNNNHPSWQASVCNRSAGRGCPNCYKDKRNNSWK